MTQEAIRESLIAKTQAKAKAIEILRDRQIAYRQIFDGDGSIAAKAVLQDLAKFCRERNSCFHPDPRIHAVLEGRREVMLRVRDYLGLSLDELFDKYGGKANEA